MDKDGKGPLETQASPHRREDGQPDWKARFYRRRG